MPTIGYLHKLHFMYQAFFAIYIHCNSFEPVSEFQLYLFWMYWLFATKMILKKEISFIFSLVDKKSRMFFFTWKQILSLLRNTTAYLARTNPKSSGTLSTHWQTCSRLLRVIHIWKKLFSLHFPNKQSRKKLLIWMIVVNTR